MMEIDALERTLARILEHTRAADQKAYILVIIQTAVPTMLATSLQKWYTDVAMEPYRLPVLLATAGWLVSLVFSALVILSRMKWHGRKSVTFFGTIQSWPLEDYRKQLQGMDEAALRNDFIDQIWICSRICSLKHSFLRYANFLFLGSGLIILCCYVYRALWG
jgi:hypothetical protein